MAQNSAVLAEVWRGGWLESSHSGHIAVVNDEGVVTASAGDPHALVFARSAWKPVQALAVVESGAAAAYSFTSAELALCAASHNAEQVHVSAIQTMLAKAGLQESDLQCGAHAPYSETAAAQLARAGHDPQSVHSNCSGKHTGMLAAAKYMGTDLKTYLEIDHPVQKRIVKTLCEIVDMREEDLVIVVDGCGAPAFGAPLAKLALLYARLAHPELAPTAHRTGLQTIRDAMLTQPQMVAGTGRFCTALMTTGGGQIVAKMGAEGVYGVGLLHLSGQSRAFAMKILDGANRAAEPAVMRTLQELGVLDQAQQAALSHFAQPQLLNVAQRVVGEIRTPFTLSNYCE